MKENIENLDGSFIISDHYTGLSIKTETVTENQMHLLSNF